SRQRAGILRSMITGDADPSPKHSTRTNVLGPLGSTHQRATRSGGTVHTTTDLSQVAIGQVIEGEFGLSLKTSGTKRSGDTFFTIELRNQTGSIASKVWDAEVMEGIEVGSLVRVRGSVKEGWPKGQGP